MVFAVNVETGITGPRDVKNTWQTTRNFDVNNNNGGGGYVIFFCPRTFVQIGSEKRTMDDGVNNISCAENASIKRVSLIQWRVLRCN